MTSAFLWSVFSPTISPTMGCENAYGTVRTPTRGKFNTHPAIIIGRLQHEELVPYSLGRQFFEPVEFRK